jgi:hypothetical protein
MTPHILSNTKQLLEDLALPASEGLVDAFRFVIRLLNRAPLCRRETHQKWKPADTGLRDVGSSRIGTTKESTRMARAYALDSLQDGAGYLGVGLEFDEGILEFFNRDFPLITGPGIRTTEDMDVCFIRRVTARTFIRRLKTPE